MDTRSPEQRRQIMQAVRSKHTGPEMTVRRVLHAMGYRYRLHRKELPGRPDIVFLGRKKALFVHGCFWHWHGCPKGQLPKTRLAYWAPKLLRNKERDRENRMELEAIGWKTLIVWQCETRELASLGERLSNFLES